MPVLVTNLTDVVVLPPPWGVVVQVPPGTSLRLDVPAWLRSDATELLAVALRIDNPKGAWFFSLPATRRAAYTSAYAPPMSEALARGNVDVPTWLALEAVGELKHELVGGELYLMAGALRRHNLLVTAILARLADAALDAGCRAYGSDMALMVAKDGYYPDVMVVCDEPVDERFEIAPCLLVEVLSPSTAATDRREKRLAYTSIPSLEAYVLADPDRPSFEIHRRAGERWVTEILGPDDTWDVPCPTLLVPLERLYRGVA